MEDFIEILVKAIPEWIGDAVDIVITAIPNFESWLRDTVDITIRATPDVGQAALGVVFFMTCFILLMAWHEGYV